MEAKIVNLDAEDIEDVLGRIAYSLNIEFENNAFKDAKTFNDFSTIILSKMAVEDTADCTSQQAFYKLRDAILVDNKIEFPITPKTPLANIFPKRYRKNTMRRLRNRLGFKLDILRPKIWISAILTIALVASIIWSFPNRELGFKGIGLSILLFIIAGKLGKELDVNTVGELAEAMVKENYIKSRRNPLTANLQEVKALIEICFLRYSVLDKEDIVNNALFKYC